MHLDICGRRTIENPTDVDIRQAVAELDGVDDSFVILDADRSGFIQAAGGPDLFYLEYAEIDEAAQLQRQYGTVNDVPAAKLVEVLVDYLHGGEAFRSLGPFELVFEGRDKPRTDITTVPEGKPPAQGCGRAIALALWMILALLAIALVGGFIWQIVSAVG